MRTSLSAVLVALLVSACSTPTGLPGKAPAAAAVPLPAPARVPVPAPPALVVAPAQVLLGTLPEVLGSQMPLPDAVTALLTHSERLRQLSPNDLTAEIAVQGDPGNVPLRQMQLALLLLHPSPAADTARALALLQRVMSNASPEALPVKPLARLLAQRLIEQRKAEEGLERQSQQLRENQRRIEQLNERLEAMRAIERSLGTRPPATPNRVRPPAP